MSSYGAGIATPEAVDLQVNRAGPGTRILARGLDTLIQFVVLVLISVAASYLAGGSGATAGVIVLLFAVPLVVFGYTAIMEAAWRGRTLGKAAFHLRVVTKEGAPVRFRHTLIRSLLYLVDGMLLGPSIGVVLLIVTKRTERLGDMAAGTTVIREGTPSAMPAPVSFAVPGGYESYAQTLDVAALSAADYEMARGYFVRATWIRPDLRPELAYSIAHNVAQKVRQPVPPGVPPEVYLLCVLTRYQMQRSGTLGPRSSARGYMPTPAGGEPGYRGAPPVPPPLQPPISNGGQAARPAPPLPQPIESLPPETPHPRPSGDFAPPS